jgi:hypothetical protein
VIYVLYFSLFSYNFLTLIMLGVTILGNNSALPAFDRHPTAQVVTLDDHLFLVDCGEGTQVQLSKYKIRWGRINLYSYPIFMGIITLVYLVLFIPWVC